MRVVYLFGAGASHASVKARQSATGILMDDLAEPIAEAVHEIIEAGDTSNADLEDLANEVVNATTDVEHVITFLDQSPRLEHRGFAEDLRRSFARVLRKQLRKIEKELKDDRFGLYVAVMEMHKHHVTDEQLHGALTLNYDDYIERAAAKVYAGGVDLGVDVSKSRPEGEALRLLKLHGSFDWQDRWPIETTGNGSEVRPLWIPPGIQKSKDRYPFNMLWGLARELLDCDLVRMVGCNVSASDWDLISLLFTTRYGKPGVPYDIGMTDSPHRAEDLRGRHPYLQIQSVLEVETHDVGREMVAELIGGTPRCYDCLSEEEQTRLHGEVDKGRNWFRLWLRLIAENLGVESDDGEFGRLLDGGW